MPPMSDCTDAPERKTSNSADSRLIPRLNSLGALTTVSPDNHDYPMHRTDSDL